MRKYGIENALKEAYNQIAKQEPILTKIYKGENIMASTKLKSAKEPTEGYSEPFSGPCRENADSVISGYIKQTLKTLTRYKLLQLLRDMQLKDKGSIAFASEEEWEEFFYELANKL